VTTTAAAAGTRRHTGTYPAEPWQVGIARAALAGWLDGGPQADEAILVASDSRHQLRPAQFLPARERVHPARRGQPGPRPDRGGGRRGPWRDGPRDDGRPHGFDVVTAIAGAGNWGIDGNARGRVAWARFGR